MGGYEDQIALTGDWLPSNGSPRSIFLSVMSDNMVGSLGEPVGEDKNQPLYEGTTDSGNTDENEAGIRDEGEIESNAFLESRPNSRGNLVERMAARAGKNAPRLNTESIRPPDIPNSDGMPTFLMTIPPGLSPTTLLESPVFLHNSQVMPSPTTGKFFFASSGNSSNLAPVTDKDPENSFRDSSSFTFKAVAESGPLSYHNPANKVYNSDFGTAPIQADGSNPREPISIEAYAKSNGEKTSNNGTFEICPSGGFAESSPSLEDANENGDQYCSDPNGSPCDDGYSWRKYGQKQVKGSEHPRSYYKCAHENCPVKKKVERSLEGDITEIVYHGDHNHPKPLPDRRDINQYDSGGNRDFVWSSTQNLNATATALAWSQEAGSTDPIQQEYTNGSGSQSQAQFQLGDGVDGLSTFSNDEDDERAVRGRTSLAYDGEGDESESKRRRHEIPYIPELSVVNRAAIREPRVVVQTMSDVDILDDGYRWRKYGQKVVKGNPNPRSYYKCTSPGCNVRKHVERASHDLKSVITTYEGKHNHDVPAARNSSHVNSGNSNNQSVSSHIHRPELSQMLANTACFRRPEVGAYRPQMNAGQIYGFGGLNQPPNLTGLAGLGKLPPLHPYSGSLTRPVNGFLVPKLEPKLEPMATDTSGLLSNDGSSLYQQLMNRLPLGP